MLLEDLSVADLAKSFSPKLHCRSDDFVWRFFNSLSFYGLAADSSGKHPSLDAHSIGAVCNIAYVFSPATPDAFFAVDGGVLRAFERLAGWRTRFDFNQYTHDH